ncbi:hypothetical protein [Acetobacter fabarum]|uniref:hypothetical protein n=1 Tax=Acetobacter fabarum TaxID=483199 RepID=UPI0039EB3B44
MRDHKRQLAPSFRAGDLVIFGEGQPDAVLFPFAYSDGTFGYGIQCGERRFPLSRCALHKAATDEQHVDALETLHNPVGHFQEVTPERAQRGDLTHVYVHHIHSTAYAEVQRSAGLLYTLRRSGTITDAAVAAAESWARDYETGVLGGKDPEKSRQSGNPDAEYAILSRIAAVDRCRYVRSCLGSVGEDLLRKIMIDGLSISQISDQQEKDRKRLSGAIELLLEQLAEVYSNMPGKMWFYRKK